MAPEIWTIVLAAGAGRRLATLTGGVPKQFWSPGGGRSLLEETLARLEPLAPPARTVIVVDQAHRRYLRSAPNYVGTKLVYQPHDRGTAAGVLLALTPVLDAAPDAIVVVTPSDHGVEDVRRFRRDLLRAASHVQEGRGSIVLFGVEPTSPNEDYGWILPVAGGPRSMRRVERFVEKPRRETATRLMGSGALWNTMVLVARARTLFDLYQEHLPGLAAVFAEALTLPAADRDAFLTLQYPELPALDFSRHLLAQARGLETCVWPPSLGWSDLGTPDRLQRWLTREDESRVA